ncbi:hypothetical protein VTP01DRAFT_6283 [Rhizomucor pusillus]|uniref:uncharacterized protein n=1 Tax=Rhizomucor pusillus TaxID=4840 RepID=UPI003743107C
MRRRAAADEEQHKAEHSYCTNARVANRGEKGRQEQTNDDQPSRSGHDLEKAQESMLRPIIGSIKTVKASKKSLMKVKPVTRGMWPLADKLSKVADDVTQATSGEEQYWLPKPTITSEKPSFQKYSALQTLDTKSPTFGTDKHALRLELEF